MNFQKALYFEVKKTVAGLLYGNANGKTPPYSVMQVIDDTGQPSVQCESQSDAGICRVQFSYAGAKGQGDAEDQLETIRNAVVAIIGVITYNGVSFEIWDNVTTGIRQFSPSLNTWDAIFETRFNWRKL